MHIFCKSCLSSFSHFELSCYNYYMKVVAFLRLCNVYCFRIYWYVFSVVNRDFFNVICNIFYIGALCKNMAVVHILSFYIL